MIDSAYLVITKHGIRKLTKQQPSLKQDELAIQINVKVPQRAFERFIPKADLVIKEDEVIPPTVDVQVVTQDIPTETEIVANGNHP